MSTYAPECTRLRLHFLHCHHALLLHVPGLQAQAAPDVEGIERGDFWPLQLRQFTQGFWQTIKGNACIQMMNVMVADVGAEPGHDRTCFHVAGRFKCGLLIGPTHLIVERHAREIMLRIEQVGADGIGHEAWQKESDEPGLPAEINHQSRADGDVDEKGNQAIPMLFGLGDKRLQAHAMKEDEDVTEEDRQRMAREEVDETSRAGGLQEMGLRHDRKRADMGAFDL